MTYHLIGILANLLNGLSLIPSVQHVYSTGDLASYPIAFLVAMVVANALWIIYGYGVGANQTAIMGAIFTSYYLLFLYWKTTGFNRD